MRDTTAVGVIVATRREAHPFGDKRHLTLAAARAAFRPPTSPLRPILPRFRVRLPAISHDFMRGNRVGPEEDALAVVNG